MGKKIRRRYRAMKHKDMKPHIFDKLIGMLPHVLCGTAYNRNKGE